MATRKNVGDITLGRNESVKIEDVIRDLRQALHKGYTRVELRDALVYHYLRKDASPLRDIIKGSID